MKEFIPEEIALEICELIREHNRKKKGLASKRVSVGVVLNILTKKGILEIVVCLVLKITIIEAAN